VTQYVIRLVSWADGRPLIDGAGWPLNDHYLLAARMDGYSPNVATVAYASDAMKFATVAEAWDYWRQQSPDLPLRPDGQPNRPLTALTVAVEPTNGDT